MDRTGTENAAREMNGQWGRRAAEDVGQSSFDRRTRQVGSLRLRSRRGFEKVLAELKTDHLDTILVHDTPGSEQMTVVEAMRIE